MNSKTLFFSSSHTPRSVVWFNFFLALLLLSVACAAFFHTQVYEWESVWEYRSLFVKGWITTIKLSIISLVLSSAIGALLVMMRKSSFLIAKNVSVIYIELIRGTPLLAQILFFYYVVANALSLDNRYVAGILILSLFSGAYIAEIFRAGIESISSSQLESAKACGLTKFQTLRLVTIPQTISHVLPPLAGQFASIIKDSSLLSIIGVRDFTYVAQQINSATYSTLETFLPLAVGYLVLTMPISLFSRYLEKKYTYAN